MLEQDLSRWFYRTDINITKSSYPYYERQGEIQPDVPGHKLSALFQASTKTRDKRREKDKDRTTGYGIREKKGKNEGKKHTHTHTSTEERKKNGELNDELPATRLGCLGAIAFQSSDVSPRLSFTPLRHRCGPPPLILCRFSSSPTSFLRSITPPTLTLPPYFPFFFSVSHFSLYFFFFVFFLFPFFSPQAWSFFLSGYWAGAVFQRSRGTYDVIGYRISASFPIGCSNAHDRVVVTTDLLGKNVDSLHTRLDPPHNYYPLTIFATASKNDYIYC